VSAVNLVAQQLVEGAVRPLWVKGEVVDFKPYRSGHWYFTLRDATSQLRAVVWSSDQYRIAAPPDEGMEVLAYGQLTVYPKRGDLQLRVTALEAHGDGLRRKALDRAVQSLKRDGLLDPSRKRRLPRFPRCVGVVTSPDSAALHDIIAVARRRAPGLRIVVAAARVQGDGAREELCAALDRLRRWGKADVVIVGRGGGAKEDLSAFNDERVARALAACKAPTVSAVGHEIDVTLCDLVADHRAPTPSAAAEAAVPLHASEEERLRALAQTIAACARRKIHQANSRLTRAGAVTRRSAVRAAERSHSKLDRLAGHIHALSPLATLARGFAVARDADGRTLSRVEAFSPGTPFELLVRDGRIAALAQRVIAAREDEQGARDDVPPRSEQGTLL
jgi:exodeoxyribonuclease VII large subunit